MGAPEARPQQPTDVEGRLMRRIIESTLLSVDGVIGSPHLWASERFDERRAPQRSENYT